MGHGHDLAWMYGLVGYFYPTPYRMEVVGRTWAVVTNSVSMVIVATNGAEGADGFQTPPEPVKLLVAELIAAAPSRDVAHLDELKAWLRPVGEPVKSCQSCGGKGEATCRRCSGDGYETATCDECGDTHEHVCSDCGGSGRTQCGACAGTGSVPVVRPGWFLDLLIDRELLATALDPIDAETVTLSIESIRGQRLALVRGREFVVGLAPLDMGAGESATAPHWREAAAS